MRRDVLSGVGRVAVGGGVEGLSGKQVVFDEPAVGVVAEGLMVDVTLDGVPADQGSGDSQA